MYIVVKLQGGLGNQLFQFAFGQSLSYRINQPVYFDITSYNNNDRALGLDKFNINLTEASDKIINIFFTIKSRLLNKYLQNCLCNKHLVHFEKTHQFYDIPLNLKGNSYYLGYWQNEDYFSNISLLLKKQITLQAKLPESNLLEAIIKDNTVAVHFRRGDYLKTNIQKAHGLTPIQYYHQAIKIILDKIPEATFIIFSDDPDWIKSNLRLSCSWIYAGTSNHYTDEETLILMSLCKHQIIANSTYSWWAAWLNSNPEKRVIAPKNWFANGTLSHSILPDTWIII